MLELTIDGVNSNSDGSDVVRMLGVGIGVVAIVGGWHRLCLRSVSRAVRLSASIKQTERFPVPYVNLSYFAF